jgi:hypothetical protein
MKTPPDHHAMRVPLILSLLLPLTTLGEEVRITVGMKYDEAVALIRKHSGKDITSGMALGRGAHAGLYWAFEDYDAIIELPERDGKVESMTYWTEKDFGESKNHRAKTEQRITALTLDTNTKGVSVEKPKPKTDAVQRDNTVFRKPFTLKLRIDKEHYYEQKVEKVPFVHDGDVYLFKDDEFGLTLDALGDTIRSVKYQPDLKKAHVTLKFTQEVMPDGTGTMLLVISNGFGRKLWMDGLMVVPDQPKPSETSLLTVEPGLKNYESWQHPIIQLMLRRLRLQAKPGA